MCTVLLPPGANPIAVNKYILSHHICLEDVKSISTRSTGRNSAMTRVFRSVGVVTFCVETSRLCYNPPEQGPPTSTGALPNVDVATSWDDACRLVIISVYVTNQQEEDSAVCHKHT